MAFSLRLPPDLDNQARIRAEQLGVPLNAVICFALDLYLRGGIAGQPFHVVDELQTANSQRVSRGGMPLKALTADGLGAKLAEKPSKAALKAYGVPLPALFPTPPDPGASKSERRAYTDHLRKNKKLNK